MRREGLLWSLWNGGLPSFHVSLEVKTGTMKMADADEALDGEALDGEALDGHCDVLDQSILLIILYICKVFTHSMFL